MRIYISFKPFLLSLILFFVVSSMSIGDYPGRLPITYSYLKTIELYQVSFEDMKGILLVLRLIANSPNLKVLQISAVTLEMLLSSCFVIFGESISFLVHRVVCYLIRD